MLFRGHITKPKLQNFYNKGFVMCPRNRGQSAIELALALPIALGLLFLIIQGFHANDRASRTSLQNHYKSLQKFDQGNGTVEIDGFEVSAGEFVNALPFDSGVSIGDVFGSIGKQLGAELGLDFALSKIKFLNGQTYLSGGLRGGISYSGKSFIGSDFKKVDWEGAAWAAASGALSSEQATQDFQGANPSGTGLREALGSSAQSAALAFTGSRGDVDAIATGATSGLFGSDTVNTLRNADVGILAGAARGALEATITGALNGNVELKNVLTASGMGAFNTKSVAKMLPFSHWEGGDPRHSRMYQATNAALSSVLRGANLEDTMLAATSGAMFSSQNMQAFGKKTTVGAAIAGASFNAGISAIKGEDLKAVGIGALQGMSTGISAKKFSQQHYIKQLSLQASQVRNSNEYIDNMINDQRTEQAKIQMIQMAKELSQSNVILDSVALSKIAAEQITSDLPFESPVRHSLSEGGLTKKEGL